MRDFCLGVIVWYRVERRIARWRQLRGSPKFKISFCDMIVKLVRVCVCSCVVLFLSHLSLLPYRWLCGVFMFWHVWGGVLVGVLLFFVVCRLALGVACDGQMLSWHGMPSILSHVCGIWLIRKPSLICGGTSVSWYWASP